MNLTISVLNQSFAYQSFTAECFFFLNISLLTKLRASSTLQSGSKPILKVLKKKAWGVLELLLQCLSSREETKNTLKSFEDNELFDNVKRSKYSENNM